MTKPMQQPSEGGSYTRDKDGALKRVENDAPAPPSTETAAGGQGGKLDTRRKAKE